MDRNLCPPEFERDVDERVAGNGPKLTLLVEYGTRDATIDSIRDISWNLSESVAGIDDGNELTTRCRRYNRFKCDGISVGTNDPIVIGEYLPMLVGVSQSVDFVNHELGVGGDVRVLGEDLVNGHHSRVGNGGSIGPIEVEGDVWRGHAILDENAVQDTVSRGTADLIPNLRPGVWTQTNEPGEALGSDIHGKGRCVLYQHYIEMVRNPNETERDVYRTIRLVVDGVTAKLEGCCIDVAAGLSNGVAECLLIPQ